jgi:hypothetical protein
MNFVHLINNNNKVKDILMDIFEIIAEDKELEEAIPFTKKAKMMKQAKKAAKGATKDEARQMEVELLTYLKTSKQQPTVDALQKYFDQKGLGRVADPIMKNFQTKGNKKTARSQARQDKARAAGQAAAKLGGLAKQGAQAAGSAVGKAATAAKNISGVVPKDKIAASMYEAEGGDPLTKREVRNIIQQVVAKGYGGAAGFDKSRFAQADEPMPQFKSSQTSPAVTKAIDMLQKAGYKVTK